MLAVHHTLKTLGKHGLKYHTDRTENIQADNIQTIQSTRSPTIQSTVRCVAHIPIVMQPQPPQQAEQRPRITQHTGAQPPAPRGTQQLHAGHRATIPAGERARRAADS